MEKVKVLFVCLGNICRSPLAEALFKDKVARKGLAERFEIDSCGTSNYHIGDWPDERTLVNALKNGIQIDHRGRQLTYKDIEEFQFIVAMDRSNYNNIVRLTNDEDHRNKVLMMRMFDPQSDQEDVPDPY
jgi:protein-tyrosine phosphatase